MQFPLGRFTPDEAARYLAGVGFSEGDIRQVNDLAHGVPGHLAIIRPGLLDGLPVERLMADLPTELSKLFDIQWKAILSVAPEDIELVQDILAILAHDHGYHTLSSLARLTGTSLQRVSMLLQPLSFLRLGPVIPLEGGGEEGRDNDSDNSGNKPYQQQVELRASPSATSGTGNLTEAGNRALPSAGADQEVAFVPEAFREYAARRLASSAQLRYETHSS